MPDSSEVPATLIDAPRERIDLFSLRLIIYAPREAAQRWITEELTGLPCTAYFAPSLRDAFDAIAEEYRRRVMVIDVDWLSKEELLDLRTLRKRGATGTFIGLGQVRDNLRTALRVTHVLPRPLGSEALRVIVAELDQQRDTVELSARAILGAQ
jgi:hypothetical protein